MKYNLYFTAYETEVIKEDIRAKHPPQLAAEFTSLPEAINFTREYLTRLNEKAPKLPIQAVAIHSEIGTHFLERTPEGEYQLELDLIQNGPWYRDFEYIKAFYVSDEEMDFMMLDHREYLQNLSPEALESVDTFLKERREKQKEIANTPKLLPDFTDWDKESPTHKTKPAQPNAVPALDYY